MTNSERNPKSEVSIFCRRRSRNAGGSLIVPTRARFKPRRGDLFIAATANFLSSFCFSAAPPIPNFADTLERQNRRMGGAAEKQKEGGWLFRGGYKQVTPTGFAKDCGMWLTGLRFGHSGFGFHSSFVISNSSFTCHSSLAL